RAYVNLETVTHLKRRRAKVLLFTASPPALWGDISLFGDIAKRSVDCCTLHKKLEYRGKD
ncbi:hypothetical protein LR032_03650, partial [Candidatus Bipolaricaulota bacterium]|nr:hypothetical protein [Candidatus Bipolaricaulota bacterium]